MDYFKPSLAKRANERIYSGPSPRKGEVAIAHVVQTRAVLQEESALFAKRTKTGRIRYRLADDYETHFDLPVRTSGEPLTTQEVLDQFIKAEPFPFGDDTGPRFSSLFHKDLWRVAERWASEVALADPEIRANLERIAEETSEEIWERKYIRRKSTWLRKQDLSNYLDSELWDNLEYEIEGLVNEDRYEAITEHDSPLTREEIILCRNNFVRCIFAGERDVWDYIPGFATGHVEDEEGNRAVAIVLCTGFSFSGLKLSVEGLFPDERDALAHLRKGGWIKDPTQLKRWQVTTIHLPS